MTAGLHRLGNGIASEIPCLRSLEASPFSVHGWAEAGNFNPPALRLRDDASLIPGD